MVKAGIAYVHSAPSLKAGVKKLWYYYMLAGFTASLAFLSGFLAGFSGLLAGLSGNVAITCMT